MSAMADVFSALCASGVPGTLCAWPTGEAPALPWFVYVPRGGGEFHADSSNFADLPRFDAELYMAEWDEGLVSRFAEAVASIGPYVREDIRITDEDCFVCTFSFTHTG